VIDYLKRARWPDVMRVFAQQVAEALRRRGNEPLAAEWLAAFSDWDKKQEQFDSTLMRLQSQPPQDVTAAERLALEATREAAHDAQNQFERVQAHTAGWFTSLDETHRHEVGCQPRL
jgi:hypothetical protein